MVRKFTDIQEKEICRQYIENKLNSVVLAEKWNCSTSIVWRIIKRNGFSLRSASEVKKMFTKEQEKQICSEYFSEERPSTDTLAKKYNCSNSAIRNALIRNGFSLRTSIEVVKDVQKMFTKKEEQQICDAYFSEEKPSTKTLAKKWNCVFVTIKNVIIRNGYVLRTRKETKSTPECIQIALKNGFGTNCYYNNEFFPSLQERDCYIKLRKLGFKIKHNFEGRFDFLINDKVVAEFHPFDLAGLTDKQYYTKRRKLLDEYGYKDLKLIVIKNLNDVKNIILI